MNTNILKLWKQMLQLAEIETDKAKLIVESEVAEGVEVFVEQDGEYVPAEDGEYEAEDKIIVVADGKIAEIREKEVEQEPEPEAEEENFAKQKFDAVKAKFEASYQEIEANIYSALDAMGIWGYLIENGDDYAIVAVWEQDEKEHLYRYEISIAEDGMVTIGAGKEVKVEYVDVDAEPEPEPEPEVEVEMSDEKDNKIADLESKVAELEAQLKMSADEPAKEKVKKEVKSGALKYFS